MEWLGETEVGVLGLDNMAGDPVQMGGRALELNQEGGMARVIM